MSTEDSGGAGKRRVGARVRRASVTPPTKLDEAAEQSIAESAAPRPSRAQKSPAARRPAAKRGAAAVGKPGAKSKPAARRGVAKVTAPKAAAKKAAAKKPKKAAAKKPKKAAAKKPARKRAPSKVAAKKATPKKATPKTATSKKRPAARRSKKAAAPRAAPIHTTPATIESVQPVVEVPLLAPAIEIAAIPTALAPPAVGAPPEAKAVEAPVEPAEQGSVESVVQAVEVAVDAVEALEVPEADATLVGHAAPAYSVDAAPEAAGDILITGICGRLGRLLARRLHRTDRVVGVDRRPFPGRPKDIVHHQLDVRRKKTRDIFRAGNIRAVVHLGVLHDPRVSDRERHKWNVVAFQKLLDYLIQYEVPKLVVLSSANVYGPQPDNPQFLTEEAPLLGSQEFRAMRDLVELDMLAQSFFWRHPKTETVILRPVHILGRVNNAPSNYLRLERPWTVMGFDPMVQVIHERDVVEACARALQPGIRGIFNLTGIGEMPLSRMLRALGKKPRSVPGPLAAAALDRMWKYRLTSFPTPELDYIRYICMVDDQRAREVLGFKPRYDLEQALRAAVSDR